MSKVPVITIDGPSSSGKGTIASLLARRLGWHLLDSGAVYRCVAWALQHYQIDPNNHQALWALLQRLNIVVDSCPDHQTIAVTCDGHDVTTAIRSESCGELASRISALPMVREATLGYQQKFCNLPGLVADGRDMGTVVFPDAALKIFLVASVEERAKRRFLQLQQQGISVSLRQIQDDLMARDDRDANRSISPTQPASDAIIIDTTGFNVDGVIKKVMSLVTRRGLNKT